MAAHGKEPIRLMQARQERTIVFANLINMYREIVGKQPKTEQKTAVSNTRVMIVDIIEQLKKALEGKYDGPNQELKNNKKEARARAVYLYAENLRQMAEVLGIKGNNDVFQKVKELFDPS